MDFVLLFGYRLTYVMRPQIEDFHSLRIAILDALNVELDDALESRPEEGVQGVPILVQSADIL